MVTSAFCAETDMLKRESKQAKYQEGPGVFTYTGGEYDTEYTPGVQKKNNLGEPVFQNGNPVWSVPPKKEQIEREEISLGGFVFKKGQPVEVDDYKLALKLRAWPSMKEQNEKPLKPDTTVEDMPRLKLMRLAKQQGHAVSRSATKQELANLVKSGASHVE